MKIILATSTILFISSILYLSVKLDHALGLTNETDRIYTYGESIELKLLK